MQTKIIYGFLAAVVILASCRKEDNPVLPDDLQRATIPQLAKDSSTDLNISGQDPHSFTGKFTLDQYFKTDNGYTSFDVVVIKNGDPSSVQVLQQNVTSIPAEFTVTGDQLTTLFGAEIVAGDFFDIGADVTLTNGQKIEAFPVDGNPNYDPNVFTLPGLQPITIRYASLCQFDATEYDGDFVVVQDDWQDYQPGDVIPVTMIDATHVSFEYAALDAQPIIVEVDLASNTTSVENQYFGNYGAGFGNFFAESDPGNANNYVAPCQGILSVVLDISSDELGPFGPFRIVLQKQ